MLPQWKEGRGQGQGTHINFDESKESETNPVVRGIWPHHQSHFPSLCFFVAPGHLSVIRQSIPEHGWFRWPESITSFLIIFHVQTSLRPADSLSHLPSCPHFRKHRHRNSSLLTVVLYRVIYIYLFIYIWLGHSRNWHDTVNQLYFNKNLKIKKIRVPLCHAERLWYPQGGNIHLSKDYNSRLTCYHTCRAAK